METERTAAAEYGVRVLLPAAVGYAAALLLAHYLLPEALLPAAAQDRIYDRFK